MTNLDKFWTSILILKSNVELTVKGDVTSQDDFNNNILWTTGNENGNAIQSKTNPHSELSWSAVKTEMDKL